MVEVGAHQQTDPLACSAKRDRLVLLALSDPKRRQVYSRSPYPTGCSAEGLLMEVGHAVTNFLAIPVVSAASAA
jgi:hypothetical protein